MIEHLSGVPPIEPIAPIRRRGKRDPEYPPHEHHAMTDEEREEQRQFDEEAKRSGEEIQEKGLSFGDVFKKTLRK